MTMREIVDQKNGIIPTDSLERLDFDVVTPKVKMNLKKTININFS
jgi:hypothetical protein